MIFGRNQVKNYKVRVTTPAKGRTDGWTDRLTQIDGQAKNNRAPPTCWRGPKYILGHTDVLINDKHVFCECQYLYI